MPILGVYARGRSNWNLSSYEGVLTEEQVGAELAAGHPIICSVGPGDFTQNGHFIVLTGYENGVIKVNDPFSQKTARQPGCLKTSRTRSKRCGYTL